MELQFCDADESDPKSYQSKIDVPLSKLNLEPSEPEEIVSSDQVYTDEDLSDDECYDEYDYLPKTKNTKQLDGGDQTDFMVTNLRQCQPSSNRNLKNMNKINVGKYEPTLRSNKAQSRIRDKQDKATTDAVLDHRGLLVINKLVNLQIIEMLNGCISTGKEANVYHAPNPKVQVFDELLHCSREDLMLRITDAFEQVDPDQIRRVTTEAVPRCIAKRLELNGGNDFAVKIFQTVNVTFKDRDKYITGEFRYRHGYCRGNPYKMIKTWAEKEYRNLNRLYSDGIPVPQPHYLRAHIILMDFVGTDGWPAPLLKDVELTQSKARGLYRDCLIIMWKMYNKSKLVHADLSEYNILYFEGKMIIIDVGQSVEHDHNNALLFLRMDCSNITKYFRRNGVATLTIKEVFDFITDPSVTESNMEEYLDKMNEKAAARSVEDTTAQEMIEEEVFKNRFIPKRLTEVIDFERDIIKAKSGNSEELVYQTLTGLKSDLSGTVQVPEILEREGSDTDTADEECEEEEEEDGKVVDGKFVRHRDESPESKKNRKKLIKELQAEKRKTKIKKHVKKRSEKKKK